MSKFLKVLYMARVSITIAVVMSLLLLNVPQAKDAVVALGNFANFFQYLFFIFIGILWALSNWYWPRSIYYMEYHKEDNLSYYEKLTIKLTPRITGAYSLFLIGFVTIKESFNIPTGEHGKGPLLTIGIIFFILTAFFLFFVFYRRKLFNLNKIGDLTSKLQEVNGIIPYKNLPKGTKMILGISTIISLVITVLITAFPIEVTAFFGDGATVLLTVFTIWIPFMYIVLYLGLRFRQPTFLYLVFLIVLFSNFNSNSDVTLIDSPQPERIDIVDFYTSKFRSSNKNMVFVLSEGGGIRAAYFSATILSRFEKEIDNFRNSIFCINGVSGGTFGASVYLSLLKSGVKPENMEGLSKQIVGKDYLSPVIGAMFTRGILQYFLPFSIESFDHAKVFEHTWEKQWEKNVGNTLFSENITNLWDPYSLPPLFINITRVENGTPFVLSGLKLKSDIIQDLYTYLPENRGLKVSSGSLLSARFPYVGPAGIIGDIGLVDGGYFDNTGSNTTFEVLMRLYESKTYNYRNNKPIIIYIKNGSDTKDRTGSSKSLLYQLTAPINTTMQLRDSNTKNNLQRVKELVKFLGGEFYTFSLSDNSEYTPEIPLGWALSETTQTDINLRVDEIINSQEFANLKNAL